MRILYGIQGTGNGHITRSTQIIDALRKKEVSIDVMISGCDHEKLLNTSILGQVMIFKGFTFVTANGRIQLMDTARQLSLLKFTKDVLSFDARGYDLVITDFEPVCSLIARKNKIPSIGIGHQYAFQYNIPMVPRHYSSLFLMRHFAPADYAVGIHWHHFGEQIIPPVISEEIKPSEKTDPGKMLVYLPFESSCDIRRLFFNFPKYHFYVYTGSCKTACKTEHNITWHPFSKTTFYKDLATCAGVICNAGFELPSEALFLGKKLLVKPLHGQFEQLCNAAALKQLELGDVMHTLDLECLAQWQEKTENKREHYPDVAERLAQWIVEGNWSDTRTLVAQTWLNNTGGDPWK